MLNSLSGCKDFISSSVCVPTFGSCHQGGDDVNKKRCKKAPTSGYAVTQYRQ